MAVETVAFSELNSWLQAQPRNTADTPYELEITGLTEDNILLVKNVLQRNSTKYVDLSNTDIPNSILGLYNCFYQCTSLISAPNIPNSVIYMEHCFEGCTSLTTAPNIPNSVTNMESCFCQCTSLTTAPNIPDSVVVMYDCFYDCTALTTAPNIPNSVTDMGYCFCGCTALTTAPNIPNSVTGMSGCFKRCISLTTAPEIPNSVTDMPYCFQNCTSLTTAPNIPSSVKSIYNCFEGCTSLTTAPTIPNSIESMEGVFINCYNLTTIPNIPSSVTNMEYCFVGCYNLKVISHIPNTVTQMGECFKNCTSLEEITLFEADLNTLIENDSSYIFEGCVSLIKIGVPSKIKESSDWHAFRLKFGTSTVEGKVYDKNGTGTAIASTSITKDTLRLPIKTDELWFPSGYTDQEIDAIIEKVIQYRYTYWNKEVLEPDKKNFVLWADDPDNSYSNLKINVASADKLSTARNLKVALGSATAQSFDGSANAESIGVSGTLPVENGGTGQTTAKGVVDETIQAGIQDATADITDTTSIITTHIEGYSSSNKSLYRRPATALWNYIKSKIQSIALTIGSTASAIAETLYGSITVKNSNGTTTASISQAGAITGASATLSGNVLGSNVPYFGTVYSSNTYSSGYYEIARLEGAAASGNHSVSMEGTVISDKTGTVTISDFYVFVRGNNATVSIAIFNCVGRYSNADLTATYEVFDTNKFRIRLYGKITANYHRYNTVIKYASTGDVSDRASNRTVTFPNAYVTAVVGTTITKNTTYAGTVANATTADTVDGYHANIESGSNLIRVTRGSDSGKTGAGYWAGMTSFNMDGSSKWWHLLSMDWSGGTANPTNWVSQIALPTQQGGVPYYRRNNSAGVAIDSSTWHKFITDENIDSQTVATATTANKIRTSAPSSPADGDIWIQ